MGARTDFWLHVHELSLCLDEEGDTRDERRANILESLDAMPSMTRQEIAREMRYVLAELWQVNMLRETEQCPPSPR